MEVIQKARVYSLGKNKTNRISHPLERWIKGGKKKTQTNSIKKRGRGVLKRGDITKAAVTPSGAFMGLEKCTFEHMQSCEYLCIN